MTFNGASNDDFINLPVPRRLYADVIQFLADRSSEAETASPASAATASRPNEKLGLREWTADDFRRLRALRPAPTVIAMLDLCAATPGHPVLFSQIRKAADRSDNQARADLGGLTRLVKNRFQRTNWPAPARWGANEMTYELGPDLAERWLQSAND